MNEIPMRAVDGDHIDTSLDSTSRSRTICFDRLQNLLFRHRRWCGVVFVPWLRCRSLYICTISSKLIWHEFQAKPRGTDTGFPTGMLKLNPNLL